MGGGERSLRKAVNVEDNTSGMVLVPMVIEQTSRGETYDIVRSSKTMSFFWDSRSTTRCELIIAQSLLESENPKDISSHRSAA